MNLAALLKIPLFHSMTETELERILSTLRITEMRFRKGEILAMQDEVANHLIILLTGSAAGEMTDPSGKTVKVEDIHAPAPLAILFLFGRDNRFPVQATALEDGTALTIPRRSVLHMLSMSQTMLKNYLDISADFAARLSRKLNMMSLRTIRQKLASHLLELSREQGSDTVTLDRPKSALAEYFGVARPSLEREITRMQAEGLIDAKRRLLSIRDKQELTRLAN